MSTSMLSLDDSSVCWRVDHVTVWESASDPRQHSGSYRFDQCDAPSWLKALTEATFHTWVQHGGQYFDQRVNGFISSSKAFDFSNRVKDGGMVATVVESANPRRAPACTFFARYIEI